MKRIVSFMMILAFLFSFTSLGQATKKKWKISLSLEKVIIESNMDKKSLDANANSFSDDLIKIQWRPEPKELKFELHNKGDVPITIMWDNSGFIDEMEKIHKIIHSKVELKQRPKPMEPTIIPPGGSITDMVYPRDYASPQPEIESVQDFRTGAVTTYEKMKWVKREIYPKKITLKEMKKKDKEFDIATYLENNKYKVILELKLNEKKYNYHFLFKSVEN